MKSTTETQLAEQSFKDYQKNTEPTDSKRAVSFMYNEYAAHYGIPLRLYSDSPQKYAKICLVSVLHYSKWLAAQIAEGWGL